MPPLIRSTDRKRRETVFRFSGTGFTLFLSALVAGMGWAPRTADAQALSERDVLVVYNGDSPVSRAAAYYYAFSRQLSQEMLLDLSIPLADPMLGDPADETITRAGYEALIQAPVAARLAELGEAAPLWIATVMGVPLRIPDDSDSELLLVDSTGASVDAELAVLGSGLEGSAGILNSKNPYFGALDGFGPWRASNPDSPLRYLVTRIAAYPTERDQFELPASVRSLIDGAGGAKRSERSLGRGRRRNRNDESVTGRLRPTAPPRQACCDSLGFPSCTMCPRTFFMTLGSLPPTHPGEAMTRIASRRRISEPSGTLLSLGISGPAPFRPRSFRRMLDPSSRHQSTGNRLLPTSSTSAQMALLEMFQSLASFKWLIRRSCLHVMPPALQQPRPTTPASPTSVGRMYSSAIR